MPSRYAKKLRRCVELIEPCLIVGAVAGLVAFIAFIAWLYRGRQISDKEEYLGWT